MCNLLILQLYPSNINGKLFSFKGETGNGISFWYYTPSKIMQNCQSLLYFWSFTLCSLLLLEFYITIINSNPVLSNIPFP